MDEMIMETTEAGEVETRITPTLDFVEYNKYLRMNKVKQEEYLATVKQVASYSTIVKFGKEYLVYKDTRQQYRIMDSKGRVFTEACVPMNSQEKFYLTDMDIE